MRRIYIKSILCAVISMLSLTAYAYDCEDDGIYYNLNVSNKTASVTSGDNKYTGSVTIPETIMYNGDSYSVTSIGQDAFYSCNSLTSITISNSVTCIGWAAFANCKSLTSITIPNSVTCIRDWAFYNCTGLTSITIPNSVTSIGYRAFGYCFGLASIIVESGNAMYDSRNDCNALIETETNTLIIGCKNTIIPNSVTSIGHDAFKMCSDLTTITIPNSVTSIGQSAFYGCGLKKIYSQIEKPFAIDKNVFRLYDDVTLYVPVGTIDANRATYAWNMFKNIVEYDYEQTGIEAIEHSPLTIEHYYTPDGVRIDNPQRGLNIVRMSDGTSRKVVVK